MTWKTSLVVSSFHFPILSVLICYTEAIYFGMFGMCYWEIIRHWYLLRKVWTDMFQRTGTWLGRADPKFLTIATREREAPRWRISTWPSSGLRVHWLALSFWERERIPSSESFISCVTFRYTLKYVSGGIIYIWRSKKYVWSKISRFYHPSHLYALWLHLLSTVLSDPLRPPPTVDTPGQFCCVLGISNIGANIEHI